MALTVAISKRVSAGNQHVTQGTITFDSSYPTGGESLTANNVGLSVIEDIVIHPSSGYSCEYDYDNEKVLVYAGGGQGAHTHDLLYIGGITATEAVAIDGGDTLGKNAATNRTIAGADSATKGGVVASTASIAAASEVAAATNLSSLTVRFRAAGH